MGQLSKKILNPAPATASESTNKLVDHFFRHESGKMVAGLVRYFGWQHFDLVEDMVQSALIEALSVWKIHGVPENPTAWIHRVTKNRVLDELRRNANFQSKAEAIVDAQPSNSHSSLDELFDETELNDSQLRMIFAVCSPALSADSAIPLTLKTLCGFSHEEIARGLLQSTESVRKRIYRAKHHLVEHKIQLDIPSAGELFERLNSVHNVLYLMFSEGYSSTSNEQAIRADVCEEAARLCHLLVEHPKCQSSATRALMALMLFHASRFESRLDAAGDLILLEEQDRRKWDRRMMSVAMEYLNSASKGNEISVYHLEAALAMHHCRARDFADTNWSAIIGLYDRLIESTASPIYQLNRAIAVGQRDGPETALENIASLQNSPDLQNMAMLPLTSAELYRMQGNSSSAETYYRKAIELTNSPHEIRHIQKRIRECETDANV